MKCLKNKSKQVFQSDCEKCISDRKCALICFNRGLAFGISSNGKSEPVFEFDVETAKKVKTDWDVWYNTTRTPPQALSQTKMKANIPDKLRWEIWERDNFTCQSCGIRRFLTVDHIIPESKGGTLDKNNLQTLCRKCNCKKGNKING